jgi:hypothetical protein
MKNAANASNRTPPAIDATIIINVVLLAFTGGASVGAKVGLSVPTAITCTAGADTVNGVVDVNDPVYELARTVLAC